MLSCLFLAAWERADLFAYMCVVFSCIFVTFPYGIRGQVWYLIQIVLTPDLYLPITFSIGELGQIKKILVFRVTRPYLNLLVKPRIFFRFLEKI